MSDKSKLQSQAEKLGVTVDQRWGEERLRTEIGKAQTKEGQNAPKDNPGQEQHDRALEERATPPIDQADKLARFGHDRDDNVTVVPVEPDADQYSGKGKQSLSDYIRSKEDAKIAEGVVLVEVSHPNAEAGLYQGTYGGVRTVKGALSAKFSDGSQE